MSRDALLLLEVTSYGDTSLNHTGYARSAGCPAVRLSIIVFQPIAPYQDISAGRACTCEASSEACPEHCFQCALGARAPRVSSSTTQERPSETLERALPSM